MRVQSMPDTCTGRHFYAFPQGWEYYAEYVKHHPSAADTYTPEWFDKTQLEPLRKELREQLNRAKNERIVSVFAFLIGTQESIGDFLVKEFGFVRTFDAHNFKYPNTSKRLFMYTRDMNDWVLQAERVKANPFAGSVAMQAAPAPVVAVQRDHVAPVQVAVGDTPIICDERGTVVHTTVRVQVGTALVRSMGRLLATQEGEQYRSLQGTRSRLHPFPANVWVAIPNELETIPPTLRGQRVDVLLSNGGVSQWHWYDWSDRRTTQDVVAVKRIVA